jgi:hypothetical protein
MWNASRGSILRDGGRRGAHGGGAWPRSIGEESRVREDGEKREKGLAMLLTTTWSSCGTCSMAAKQWRVELLRGPRRAGLGCRAGRGGVPGSDLGSNPSRARGRGRTRWAGPLSGEGEREANLAAGLGERGRCD